MPQVRKPEIRRRIVAGAEQEFFESGFHGATIGGIARRAGVSAANVYRYFPDKAALFDAVLPDSLIAEHDRLLDERIRALIEPIDAAPTASVLLDHWVEHRRSIALLLDHPGETSRSWYRDAFVERMVTSFAATTATPLSDHHRFVLTLIFDNTRRALAMVLRTAADDEQIRAAIEGFWSYQVPGLDGLKAWIDA